MKKLFLLIGISALSLGALSACQSTDVIANQSIDSFKSLVDAMAPQADAQLPGYRISAPDQSVTLLYSSNLSQTQGNDVELIADLTPFIAAGLDTTLMPEGLVENGQLVLGQSLKDADAAKDDAVSALETLIVANRDILGFHESLGHYNISLGNGNLFEWAKDASANDKDMVFVLDPQIFIDAKADPAKIAGWTYAEVMVMDKNGNEVKVMKLLKPFNLQ